MRAERPLQFILALGLLAGSGEFANAQSGRDQRIADHLRKFESGFGPDQESAAAALLMVDPSSVDAELRKKIARAFREEALNGTGHDKGPAIRGLVHWAGDYSLPVLIEIVQSAPLQVDPAVFEAIVEIDDPEGAEGVAAMLGNFFNHDAAVECLKQMGPTAEPVMINAAKLSPGKASMGAIEVLGEIGGEKALASLTRLSGRGPAEQRSAAKMAAARIRSRLESDPAPQVAASAPASDDPFADPAPGSGGAGGSHPDEGDWDQVENPLPQKPAPGSFKPNPAPKSGDVKPARFKPARLADVPAGSLQLPVAVSPALNDPTRGAVVTRDHMGGAAARGQLIDLRAGKARRSLELPPDTVHAALSPSGKRLVTVAEEGTHAERMRIDIWELAHTEPKLIDSWRPFRDDDKMWGADAMWTAWTDEDHVLTLNRAGDLVLWDAVGAVARYQWQVDGWSTPVLSPGGQQVAAVTEEGVVVFDTKTGECVAWVIDGPARGAALGFDPSGARFACVTDTRVRIWDLAKGEVVTDFHVMDIASVGADFNPPVSFVGDDRIVVRGPMFVDVVDLDQRRVVVRGEHRARTGAGVDGVSLLAYVGSQRSALYPEEAPTAAKLPSPKADADEMLAIKPGAKVALDVRVGGDLDAPVREILAKAIEEAGLVLVDDAPNKFVARQETKSELVTYRNIHTPPWVREGSQQVNVEEKIYTVTLFIDGEPAWRYLAQQRAQHMLRSQGDESFQQAADRAMQASARYFEGADLPRYLVHPEHAGPLKTVKLRGG
jgi:hypothetical protein